MPTPASPVNSPTPGLSSSQVKALVEPGEEPIVPQLGVRLAQGVVLQAEVLQYHQLSSSVMAVVLAVGQFHLVVRAGAAGRWRLGRLGFAPLALDIGHRIQGRGRPERLPVVVLHAEDLPGVGIDHQTHGPSGQLVGHLETLALIGDGAILAHLAL